MQASPDASPTKWHLGHTTWFYEAFLLVPHLPAYKPFDEAFSYCFNSYYESLGSRQPRAARGLMTRPSCEAVRDYRTHVDEALEKLAERSDGDPAVSALLELGINHEQQHQELLLTDILCLFAAQPLRPVYLPRVRGQDAAIELPSPAWRTFEIDSGWIGHADPASFAYDHEGPRHRVALQPFRIATRLVTNSEWLEFIRDGGYSNPLLWLADGWTTVQSRGWAAPGYWEVHDGVWHHMSLRGFHPVDPAAPVVHVSYFEADAFARWAGKRLPTEAEWEVAAADAAIEGNTLGSGALEPRAAAGRASAGNTMEQVFGDVWEWTRSAFAPYPGYWPPAGAVGEYNSKFMVSQQVLRGASCVTPDGHTRATYRNFFYPHQRWQFAGVRLAEDMV